MKYELRIKNRVLAAETIENIGKEVRLSGWVRARRDHGKLIFIDLRDRSGIIQVVFNPQISKESQEKASEFRPEDVVSIVGTVKKRPENLVNLKIQTGTVEIEATEIEVIRKAETLPFDMGGEELNLELPTLLDYRPLTLRHPNQQAIFTVQAALLEGFRKTAGKLGCVEIVVPTIVASSTEGGAELFRIDYYEHDAYLSQSPQLYKQMMVPVFERVFTIAKAYRAEPSVTTRHLTETTQMDIECGFVTFEQLQDMLEMVGIETVKHAQEKCLDIFSDFNLESVAFGKIPRFTLRQAQDIIHKNFGRDNTKEKDLTPQDEIDLCIWARKERGSEFVTITHFPTTAKPFYIMPDSKDPEYSLSYDLLFRGVEILSGGQRIHEYEQLVKSLQSRGMNPESFKMYLMAFKYGMPPEGGFSFGLERMTMKLLGLSNVREASLFPRDMERVDTRFSKRAENIE